MQEDCEIKLHDNTMDLKKKKNFGQSQVIYFPLFPVVLC